VEVVTLSENLYPDCPTVPIEGNTLESVLDHHKKLVPAYDKCRKDVIRAIEYLDKKKSESNE